MKIKITKNKYLNALFLLMLFSASLHMVILFVLALVNQDLSLINYFNILNVNYFFQGTFNGILSNLLSFAVVGVIYIIILKVNGPHEQ